MEYEILPGSYSGYGRDEDTYSADYDTEDRYEETPTVVADNPCMVSIYGQKALSR